MNHPDYLTSSKEQPGPVPGFLLGRVFFCSGASLTGCVAINNAGALFKC